MRQRLVASTLGAVLVAVVLLGLPLTQAFSGLLERQALEELEQQVRGVEPGIARQRDPAARAQALEDVTRGSDTRFVLVDPLPGRFALVVDTAGRSRRGLVLDDDTILSVLRRGRVVRAHADGALAVAVPVAGSLVLIAQRADDDLRAGIGEARLAIAVLAAAALGAAALASVWQGRRLARPLEDLAAAARRLGDGDFTARAPRSGLPEQDDVASALDATGARLGALVARSASFTADASHQLRTPLTALRLDLESLELAAARGAPADPALVAAAVAEADRLEATITELLDLTAGQRGSDLVDVAALAADRLDAWRALARAQGREVVLAAAPAPPVRARAAALGQSLQVLLDNALTYGRGTVTVSVGEAAGGGVRLCVADEGAGIPPDREAALFDGAPRLAPDRSGHSGRGLPLARSLVEAEGGRITLERARPGAVVCLLLPAAGARP